MAIPRPEPYIWATWLPRLLAGEAHCEWALWFRAHHEYERRAQDFDLSAWSAKHAELLRARAARLKDDGFKVYIEEQNKFTFRGQATIVQAKPDIVAVRDRAALVVDCKTGIKHNADQLQVLLYMLLLPRVHHACRGLTVAGELCYSDHEVQIPPSVLTPDIQRIIKDFVTRAAGAQPTPRVPSYGECRYCDIAKADCPERVEVPPENVAEDRTLF